MTTIGLVAAAAGGVEAIRDGLALPLITQGHQVAITVTPTAARWLDTMNELSALERLTGLPVRSQPRLPGEPRPHPPVDLYIAAPLTANSTAKLALGIADNQALTALTESIATVPMIVFPRINAAHARQPTWPDHIARLRSAGVRLIEGDAWPLAEPRTGGTRQLPWHAILRAVADILSQTPNALTTSTLAP